MVRSVIFALHPVLDAPTDRHAAAAALIGVDDAAYRERYPVGREGYEAGGSRVEYWLPLLRDLGVPPHGDLVSRLAELDVELQSRPRPGALELLQAAHDRHLATATLANGPLPLARALAIGEWPELLDRAFLSAELGVLLPDPVVFAATGEALGLPPEQIALVDAEPAHLGIAADLGWQTHGWAGDADCLAWLDRLG